MIKQFYSTLLLAATLGTVSAQSPTIDGTISAGEGWQLAATADQVAGWSGANARKLYYAQDAAYYYLAAELNADGWMSYGFIVNAIPMQGGTSDGWARQINYTHTEKPDLEIRGNLDNSWAEVHLWSGTAWTGGGTNITTANAMVNLTSGGTYGAVEVRIPKAATGTFTSVDAQFYITGNNNDHGSFDAVPNDNNATGWTPPASVTNLSQYVSINTTLNVQLQAFNGSIAGDDVKLEWSVANAESISEFHLQSNTSAENWKTETVISGNGNQQVYTTTLKQSVSNGFYRLKIIDKANKVTYSNVLLFKKQGNNTITLLENPVRNTIRFSLQDVKEQQVQATVYSFDGRRVVGKSFNHQPGTAIYTVDLMKAKPGVYIITVVTGNESNSYRIVVL